MLDTSEKNFSSIVSEAKKKSDTIVIDNGTFEIKAGYLYEPSIVNKNRIFKYKERISLDPFPSSSVRSMFDLDVITNFDTLEYTIDQVLMHLKPDMLKNLIFTATPCSPTEQELVEFFFEVYKFEKIQIGFDFIYEYHKYFDRKDCIIVDFKFSCTIVCVVNKNKIVDIYKINFGGKDLLEYINHIMHDKYKENRKDYKGLVSYLRVSNDYNKEALDIYSEMCSGIYKNNVFLTEAIEIKSPELVKKQKRTVTNPISVPTVDYVLLNTPDEGLDRDQVKEKKRLKMIFCSTMARVKSRIDGAFKELSFCLQLLEEELEKKSNFKAYLSKKKELFSELKREYELREQIRKDSKNKKSREFAIKFKEGSLTEEEAFLKNKILDAEDDEKEKNLVASIDDLAQQIMQLDPEFIPFYANTVEILRGDNLGRQCVNIELIKWPEIFFDPSIIGSEQMGLTEIFENILQTYQIPNVLVTGGFSFISNLDQRIKNEIQQLLDSKTVNLVRAENPRLDPFYGAKFSDLLPTYTRSSYNSLGAKKMIEDQKQLLKWKFL